jgi:CheY-like chemotaxis protein
VINDILDFSKIEAGKTELRSELFEPATLLATVAETFEPQAAGKGIRLKHFVSGNVPAKLMGDEGRIRQILFNLLGNAVKFTDKGEVRVNLDAETEQDGRLRLICNIEDTGMGISDELLHKVFEPFTQLDGTLSRKHQGSGLGLSIVKRLATLMGGDVSIKSRMGSGTTVSFDVLTKTAQTGEAETETLDPTLPADHTTGLHILVAEDNPISQVFTAKILEKIGHRPTVVANGEEVLEALVRHNYDLVLMDVQMPLMDGIEATAKIRAHSGDSVDPNIPIVAMTAHAMQGDREKCLEAGMDGYVSKPVDMDELTTTISRIAADQKRCN